MKKITPALLIPILMLFSFLCWGQVEVIENGNVGIGTSTPDEKLHVESRIKITGYNRPALILHKNAFDVNWSILAGVNSGFYIKPTLPNTSSTDEDSYFSIRYSGYVGVGIWAPTAKFHIKEVNTDYRFADNHFRMESKNPNQAFPYLSFYQLDAGGVSERGAYIGGGIHGNHIKFRLENNNDLAITGGKVGIGTTAPVEELVVMGKAILGEGTIATPGTRRDVSVRSVSNDGGVSVIRNAGLDDYTGYYFSADNSTPKAHKAGLIFRKKASNGRGILQFLINDDDNDVDVNLNDIVMTIDRGGNIGIGTEDPSDKLQVIGDIRSSGNVFASCGTLSCSDIRYKENFKKLESPLAKIQLIDGLYYDWKKDAFPEKGFDDKTYLGFKAQEVEQQFPEMVHTDSDGYKSVDYSRMTVVLLESIKEQQGQIASLQQENEMLKNQMTEVLKYIKDQSENTNTVANENNN